MEKRYRQWQHSQIPCEASSLVRDGLKTHSTVLPWLSPIHLLGFSLFATLFSRPARAVRWYLHVWRGGQSFCNFIRSLVVAGVYFETCGVALFTPAC